MMTINDKLKPLEYAKAYWDAKAAEAGSSMSFYGKLAAAGIFGGGFAAYTGYNSDSLASGISVGTGIVMTVMTVLGGISAFVAIKSSYKGALAEHEANRLELEINMLEKHSEAQPQPKA